MIYSNLCYNLSLIYKNAAGSIIKRIYMTAAAIFYKTGWFCVKLIKMEYVRWSQKMQGYALLSKILETDI